MIHPGLRSLSHHPPPRACFSSHVHRWAGGHVAGTSHCGRRGDACMANTAAFCPAQVVGGAWLFSRLYCNIFVTLDVMMCTASILNLCAISIDRWVGLHLRLPWPQQCQYQCQSLLTLKQTEISWRGEIFSSLISWLVFFLCFFLMASLWYGYIRLECFCFLC